MNQADFRANTPYAALGSVVAAAPEEARRTFIRKTYTHLAAAIYAFVMIEWLFVQMGLDQKALELIGQSRFMWLAVLGGFMAVSWVADSWAQSATSIGKQYAGLFLYVLAQAVIFLPMIGIAKFMTTNIAGHEVPIIGAAGITTLRHDGWADGLRVHFQAGFFVPGRLPQHGRLGRDGFDCREHCLRIRTSVCGSALRW